MDYSQQEFARKTISDGAIAAQIANPQFEAFADNISGILGVDLDNISAEEKRIVMLLITALQNSLGPLLGLDNGARQFEAFHRGATNIGIPVISTSHSYFTGGPGAGSRMAPLLGEFYGAGNSAAAVANQLTTAFTRAAYNKDGTTNTAFTGGVNVDLLAQAAGQIVKERGWQQGDVVMADFGRTADDIQRELTRLTATSTNAPNGIISKDSFDYIQYEKLLRYRMEYDRIKAAGSTNMEALKMMRENPEFSNEETLRDLQMQLRGSLRGTQLNQRVPQEVNDAVQLITTNLKTLSELTGIKDLHKLQDAADSLRLGSLTDTKQINQIGTRMREWRVEASMSNRDVKEVMLEQKDIADAMAYMYGGHEYVPGKNIAVVQRERTMGRMGFEAGHTIVSGDERAARMMRTQQMAEQRYRGIAVLEKTVEGFGANVPKELQAQYESIMARYEDALEKGDNALMYSTSLEAHSLAYSWNPMAYENLYVKGAIATSSRDFAQDSHESNIVKNADKYLGKLEKAGGNGLWKYLDNIQLTPDEAGNARTLDRSMLVQNVADNTRLFGGDTISRDQYSKTIADILDTKDEIKRGGKIASFLDQISVYDKETRDLLERELNFALSINDPTVYRQWTAARAGIINNAAELSGTQGMLSEEERARVSMRSVYEELVQTSSGIRTHKSGVGGFLAGLLKNGSIEPKEMAAIMMAESQEQVRQEVEKLTALNPPEGIEGHMTLAQIRAQAQENVRNRLAGKINGTILTEDSGVEILLAHPGVRNALGLRSDAHVKEFAEQFAGEDPEVLHGILIDAAKRHNLLGTQFFDFGRVAADGALDIASESGNKLFAAALNSSDWLFEMLKEPTGVKTKEELVEKVKSDKHIQAVVQQTLASNNALIASGGNYAVFNPYALTTQTKQYEDIWESQHGSNFAAIFSEDNVAIGADEKGNPVVKVLNGDTWENANEITQEKLAYLYENASANPEIARRIAEQSRRGWEPARKAVRDFMHKKVNAYDQDGHYNAAETIDLSHILGSDYRDSDAYQAEYKGYERSLAAIVNAKDGEAQEKAVRAAVQNLYGTTARSAFSSLEAAQRAGIVDADKKYTTGILKGQEYDQEEATKEGGVIDSAFDMFEMVTATQNSLSIQQQILAYLMKLDGQGISLRDNKS